MISCLCHISVKLLFGGWAPLLGLPSSPFVFPGGGGPVAVFPSDLMTCPQHILSATK